MAQDGKKKKLSPMQQKKATVEKYLGRKIGKDAKKKLPPKPKRKVEKALVRKIGKQYKKQTSKAKK